MPQKYYNSKETAELLGITPEEVKQMLDRREIYGYRDGADWKFKVEDIDRMAKERAPHAADLSDDQDDVLLSEHELGQSGPGASGTVIGMEGDQKARADSDLQLADSDIRLGEDTPAAGADAKAKIDSKVSQFEELDLTLDEDLTLEDSTVGKAAAKPGSKAESKAKAASDSAVDLSGKELEDDDLVLGGSGAGSDITIGGDSGISLVDPADSGLSLEDPIDLAAAGDESLELGEDDMVALADDTPAAAPSGVRADDDFLLQPMEEAADGEDSESGSQVIALDTEGDESATMIASSGGIPSMAAMLDEDVSAEPVMGGMAAAAPLAGMGIGAPAPGGPAMGMPAGAAMMLPDLSLPETPYTGGNVAALAVGAVLLMLCGMFMFDLMRNMWSWDAPYSLNSSLMDTILGWFGQQ